MIIINATGCLHIKDNKLKDPNDLITYRIRIKTQNIINYTIFLPYSENWTTMYNDVVYSKGNATFRVEETICGNVLSVNGTNNIHYVFYTEYNDSIYYHFTLIDCKIDKNVSIFCEKIPPEGRIYLEFVIIEHYYGGQGVLFGNNIFMEVYELNNGWDSYPYLRNSLPMC